MRTFASPGQAASLPSPEPLPVMRPQNELFPTHPDNSSWMKNLLRPPKFIIILEN
jgi:hypothetical protein